MKIVEQVPNYNLRATLYSGQIFRFREGPNGVFKVYSNDKFCYVIQNDHQLIIEDEMDFNESYWRNFFSLDFDLSKLDKLVAGNSFLQEVCDFSQGLTLLRQDPWETLISFIISQQKRIPQIQECIENLCRIAGFKFPNSDDYEFPIPERLSYVDLKDVHLGYREKYVATAANYVSKSLIDLNSLKRENGGTYGQAIQALCEIYGVGIKVANCVALFSLGHTNAFPVDVHIDRILKLPEMKNFSASNYGDYAGLLQQYLFNYAIHHGI